MLDPFKTLGMEPRLEVDWGVLESRFRSLSRALHPDRYVGRPPSERREALERAIEVNEAFRILRDPVTRAEAMLNLYGVSFDERHVPNQEPNFLMEMMETRERLARAVAARDGAALDRLRDEAQTASSKTLAELATLLDAERSGFEQGELDTAGQKQALTLVGKLRYFRRLLDEADSLAERIV